MVVSTTSTATEAVPRAAVLPRRVMVSELLMRGWRARAFAIPPPDGPTAGRSGRPDVARNFAGSPDPPLTFVNGRTAHFAVGDAVSAFARFGHAAYRCYAAVGRFCCKSNLEAAAESDFRGADAGRQAGRTAAARKPGCVCCVSVALRVSCPFSVVGVSSRSYGRKLVTA